MALRSALFLPLTAALLAGQGCSHAGLVRVPSASDKHDEGGGANHDKKHGGDANSPTPGATGWLELGPGGAVIARELVSDGTACPSVAVDGKDVELHLRVAANAGFPQAVCESALPPGAKSVVVGGGTIAVPASPQRILVLGDTGCRIKQEASGKVQTQDCNDPAKWPFAALAGTAAGLKPDLVVHLGDYHYREFACPDGDEKCAGSPTGDTWDSWRADFFSPAAPLLAAAPWVFVRGNHEVCARAQEGFFRLLDPRPYPASCAGVTDPYAVNFADLTLAVLDSSMANPTAASLGTLKSMSLQGAWLVTHRPLWLSPDEAKLGDDDGDDEDIAANVTAQTIPVGPAAGASLVLTGHRHLFRTLTFADGRAPQITLGNGGTKLQSHPSADAAGTSEDGGSTTVTSAETQVSFGFALFVKKGGAWSMQVYDLGGNQTGSCSVAPAAGVSLACKWGSGS